MPNKFNFNIMNGEEEKTVLVVDDEPAITKMSKRILEKFCNVNVITANTVKEGIKIINEERGNIDLLVSDWDVNANDGAWAEAIKAGKEAGIEPIIGWSGRAGHPSVDDLIKEAGATIVILKDLDAFIETIRTMFGDIQK